MARPEVNIVLWILGIVTAISFVGKIFFQFLMDIKAFEDNKDGPPVFFRVRYLLPYTELVPGKFAWMKKLCNLLYYIFLSSALLYIFLWNLR